MTEQNDQISGRLFLSLFIAAAVPAIFFGYTFGYATGSRLLESMLQFALMGGIAGPAFTSFIVKRPSLLGFFAAVIVGGLVSATIFWIGLINQILPPEALLAIHQNRTRQNERRCAYRPQHHWRKGQMRAGS